jgi:ABC transporter substrate binding protein
MANGPDDEPQPGPSQPPIVGTDPTPWLDEATIAEVLARQPQEWSGENTGGPPLNNPLATMNINQFLTRPGEQQHAILGQLGALGSQPQAWDSNSPHTAPDLVSKMWYAAPETSRARYLAATSTIPIAFIIGGDPVKLGLAASYGRPGANATGITILTATLEPKRLELLRELVPQASTIGAFLDPNFPPYEDQLRDLREAARTLDLQVHELRVSTDAEIDLAFKTIAEHRIGAIMVTAGPFFDTRREKLVTLASHYAVPTIYHFREFTAAGGLMSYGIDSRVTYRQIGVYAGAILKGERPADLPRRSGNGCLPSSTKETPRPWWRRNRRRRWPSM